jgi:hypothetical protein
MLTVLLATAATARADDTWMQKVMTFAMDGDHIVAEGAFAPDTADTFKAFANEHAPGDGRWNMALYIRSPGGALGAALNMGYYLRARGMSVVAYDTCASACTYMLMGGVNRVVTREGRYGVHQFSFEVASLEPEKPVFTAKDVEQHQNMVGELADYADSMGVDPRVVIVASRTPPSGMTFLTREQLVGYNVDNVPTDEPEGQSNGSVIIPGLTEQQIAGVSPDPTSDTSIFESLKVNRPSAEPETSIFESLTIKPHALSSGIAMAIARRLVMAETQDLAGMEESLANSYAQNVEYNGHIMSGDAVVAEKRRMVSSWGVRRRTIHDDTLQVSCENDDLWCTVTGEYDYELGPSENSFIAKARWRFSMEVALPLVLPRVTQETLSQVQ